MNLVKADEPWLDSVPTNWASSRIRNIAQLFLSDSHMPHLEETEKYLHVLTEFPDRVESQAAPDGASNVVDSGSS